MASGNQTLSFAEYLARVQAKSGQTVAAYDSDLTAYAVHCERQGRRVDDSLTRTAVGLYLVNRTEERRRRPGEPARLSSRSAARVVSALSAYGQYQVFLGNLKQNPLAGVKGPKYSRKLPPYYKISEISRLLDAFTGKQEPAALRNLALLHLLYATGLRASECTSLNISSVRLGERMLRVTGKGGRQREVPFGEQAAAAVQDYLDNGRPQLLKSVPGQPGPGDALFLSTRGNRLRREAINKILDKAAAIAGLIKPVTPHKLRHACATHMLEGGADIRLLQELLGHESLNTTQVYTQVTRTQLREVYKKTHPRAKK